VGASVGGGGNIVHGHDRHVAADGTVAVGDGEGCGISAVVVGYETERRAGTIGDSLAVASNHVPVERVGFGTSRIAERSVQRDGVAFIDRLIAAGIGGRSDVIDRDYSGVRANSAIVIGDGERDRVGPSVVR